ncbi:MAG TPA: NADH-quinone oxidoreductase subunit NuoE [Anaerolineaceae bacterium]
MTVNERQAAEVHSVVEAVIEEHGASREEIIPILNAVNDAIGYVPASAMEQISRRLRVPRSQLFSVATFYQMLSTTPRGKHVVQFCESAPCHVVGGRQVWESLLDTLHLEPGATSPDGKWTLITTSCLGVCGVGPVILIDGDVYGNVTPDQIPGILARYA